MASGVVGTPLPGHTEPSSSAVAWRAGLFTQEHTVSSGPFGGHSFQLILSKLSITCARAPQTCSEQNKKARGKTERNEPFCSLVGILPRVWLGSLPTMWRLWMMSRRKGRSQSEDDLNSGLMSFSTFAHHVFSQSKLECLWWLQGEFAQLERSAVSEGFCSGNCKTWVGKGVNWIIYKLDMELICHGQKLVKAHVLPIADIFVVL